MPTLEDQGLAVELPPGWSGRIARRADPVGTRGAAPTGPDAGPERAHERAVLHASSVELPPGAADFGSDVVPRLGRRDVFVSLFEHGPESVGTPLFDRPRPRSLRARDLDPAVLQRSVAGQAGAQVFFTEAGRAFCLYVVVGSWSDRRRVLPLVNALLATLRIEPAVAPSTSAAPVALAPSPSTATPGGAG